MNTMSTEQADEGRAADPAMFAPLTTDELAILSHHLTSGWYKQGAVYPTLSEHWRETCGLLKDLHTAHMAHFPAEAAVTP